MKYLFQFCIIGLFTFLGELLHALIPFPIPAAIWGLILLFLALLTGILRPG
jgi:holin-like protein